MTSRIIRNHAYISFCYRNATVIDSNETEIRLKYDIYMRHKRNRNATKIRHKCYIKATDMRQ